MPIPPASFQPTISFSTIRTEYANPNAPTTNTRFRNFYRTGLYVPNRNIGIPGRQIRAAFDANTSLSLGSFRDSSKFWLRYGTEFYNNPLNPSFVLLNSPGTVFDLSLDPSTFSSQVDAVGFMIIGAGGASKHRTAGTGVDTWWSGGGGATVYGYFKNLRNIRATYGNQLRIRHRAGVGVAAYQYSTGATGDSGSTGAGETSYIILQWFDPQPVGGGWKDLCYVQVPGGMSGSYNASTNVGTAAAGGTGTSYVSIDNTGALAGLLIEETVSGQTGQVYRGAPNSVALFPGNNGGYRNYNIDGVSVASASRAEAYYASWSEDSGAPGSTYKGTEENNKRFLTITSPSRPGRGGGATPTVNNGTTAQNFMFSSNAGWVGIYW